MCITVDLVSPTPLKNNSLISWNASAGNDLTLLCIPWAGAGAAPFRPWSAVIADVATVYGLRLAGRENRREEPPASKISDVVADVIAELVDLGVQRVALFGQCSGAVLAFELAKALTNATQGIEVTHLFVASQLPPPDFTTADVEADQDFTRYVPEEFRGEPDFVELLLPIIAADIALMSSYVYEPGTSLTVPITVLYGAHDKDVSRAQLEAWRQETSGLTNFYEIAGGDHLLGGDAWLELAQAVRTGLT